MKVSVLQEKLAKGLTAVGKVVSMKPTLPILSNVLLVAKNGRLELFATDLNIGIRLWIGAKVEEEGEITVPGKIFSELINSLPATTIKLSLEETSLLVSGAGSKAKLAGVAASEFPSLGKISDKKGLSRFIPDKIRKFHTAAIIFL